jgi:argonaute-like protein implicated in RNA metabolism and viral defense
MGIAVGRADFLPHLNWRIPRQFVTAANLQNPSQRAWVLGNIALASYAKVGGAPWVVADSSGRHELVMGVSRAQEETNNPCYPEDDFACSSEIGAPTS